ncbi:MAG: hypothetical protein J7647_29085 [Cyanobacteria bacterium SBLK]|nr:hypothetical protein [Cyanobacteria bacterium SBLK]
MPGDSRFHGIVFNSIAELFFQIQYWIKNYSFAPLLGEPYVESEVLTYNRYLTKHTFTFLISLITYISVAGGISLLYQKKWAWLPPLVLVCLPRFWGHSFFNPKDIPFAALFTLCIYLGAYVVGELKKNSSPLYFWKIKRKTIWAISYGILVGLLSGIRIGGFIILGFLGLTSLLLIPRKNIGRSLLSYFIHYSLMTISWGLTVFCFSPSSWSNPFQWFWDAIQYFSQHEWAGTVLFKGEQIKASELPWDYLPTWFLITTPIIILVYFLLGLIGLVRTYSQFRDRQKAYSLLLILQMFTLPAIAIVKGSTIYDGIRHFLFVLPGIAVIASVGLIWSYQQISQLKFKRALVAGTLLCVAIVIFDMVTLHPYEYIYFNRVSGGLKAAQNQYETEYWGLSMRKGIEWLNENVKKDTVVVVPAPWMHGLVKPFAESRLTITNLEQNFEDLHPEESDFYYLAPPRFNWQTKICSERDFVYTVTRQDVSLTRVKKCQSKSIKETKARIEKSSDRLSL